MRRICFVLVCTLIAAGVFAEAELLEQVERNTAEGQYFMSLYRVGKNLGQRTADELIQNDRKLYSVETSIKLSAVQWNIIRQALGRYRHSQGDTYALVLYNTTDWVANPVVVEYTSATQYTYWVWLVYNASGFPLSPPDPFPDADEPPVGPPPPIPYDDDEPPIGPPPPIPDW
jgi:hypothetical protein